MLRWARNRRKGVVQLTTAALISTTILVVFVLPPDNTLTLGLRFATHNLLSIFPSVYNSDAWFRAPARFPVDMDRDVAVILKTGYGTRDRLPAQLAALGLQLTGGRDEAVMVVADFWSHWNTGTQDFEIHDMLEAAAQNEALEGQRDAKRFQIYHDLSRAIRTGEEDVAMNISRHYGWELDAMKFIPSLERAWRKLHRKPWYLMLDDDTFIIRPSLQLLLGHMDPTKPSYLGNAVGDFKGRFAHGGSAIAISAAAMQLMFDERPDAVRSAYRQSLTETWGDRLVAHMFMKGGVYLDERYGRLFNGERPLITRIRADRFCAPLVSFHQLNQPAQMLEVGSTFKDVSGPVYWSDLLKIYGQSGLAMLREDGAITKGFDHVGRIDESTTMVKDVRSAVVCLDRCNRLSSCLAWKWIESQGLCHLAPWMIIGGGEGGEEEVYSGVHIPRVQGLQEKCNVERGKGPSL